MIVAIDTREQKPFDFGENVKTKVVTLQTGDYSLVDYESKITIERKSLPDLFNTVGRGRKRFEKELSRMSEFDFAAIVIEGNWYDMWMKPPIRTQVTPRTVIRSLLAWAQRYDVHMMPCGPRRLAARVTYIMLERFWKDTQENKR